MVKTRTENGELAGSRKSWRLIGPGIVVAATGVGAGDLVATLMAGSRFGYTLLWAAVVGCIIKIVLAEAAGRWHLATGRTILDGWHSLGAWTTVYFAVYVVVWGYVYGAAAMSSSALPIAALFPGTLDFKAWAILCGLVGLAFVWFNRYAVVEKIMMVFGGVMFLVVVTVAIRVTPDFGDTLAGLAPVLPSGSLLYTLGLIGGVGGTITLAAYGYWINAKGWTDSGWIRMMRLDNRVAYITTGIFVVAMLIVGAELLHASNIALGSGDQGLLDLGEVLENRFGSLTANLFLVGFFAASFSSLVGVWHGVSLLFADFVARARAGRRAPGARGDARATGAADTVQPAGAVQPGGGVQSAGGVQSGGGVQSAGGVQSGGGVQSAGGVQPDGAARSAGTAQPVVRGERERSLPFRGYLLWLTLPPIPLLWLDQPFGLVIAYGVLGAAFMPFLALTLLRLLNSERTPRPWRNGIVSNVLLSAAGLMFLVLCVQQIRDLPW